MNNEEAILVLKSTSINFSRMGGKTAYVEALEMAITALENAKNDNLTPESAQNVQKQALKMQKSDALGAKTGETCSDTISRQAAIDVAFDIFPDDEYFREQFVKSIEALPSVQPDGNKYEYHYDHTDCIWYRPEARNRCPVTCAQYRDGWNDAMNYIFRDGKGYRPYRRDKKYE